VHTDSTVEAARDVVGDALDRLLAALDGLTTEQLNRRPAGELTNPAAVLVAHALASTRSWLSLATGAPLPLRDRPTEFLTVAEEADVFRAWAAGQAAECLGLFDGDVDHEPGRTGLAPWRSGALAAEPVTAAWALAHATAHLGEHVGHLQMTRDVLTRP
jgi:hypothetical protein